MGNLSTSSGCGIIRYTYFFVLFCFAKENEEKETRYDIVDERT